VRRIEKQRRLSQGTSGRIVDLLRKGEMTIDELAAELGLTRTAVRSQLATHLRDGIVQERGVRRGASKPARTYGLSSEAELQLSRAYAPILAELLHVLSMRLTQPDFVSLMHEVGQRLATGRSAARGPLTARVADATELLGSLGAMTTVTETDGRFTILGHGCPLGAVTANHPEACKTIEALLSEFIGAPVTSQCQRYDRRRCCFEIEAAAS
jgi:predicted ArsR family transcriptional regulator